MRVGAVVPYPIRGKEGGADELAQGAANIEVAGFDSIWAYEVVCRRRPTWDPLAALAVAAAVTRKVELGTCIVQVPLHAPAVLAQRVMTLHMLARDRLLFGVGSGSTKEDFDAAGADFTTRFETLSANLATMQALWRGETVDGVNLHPWESTLGGPKIVIGSWHSGTWIPRAAKEFHAWMASARRGGKLAEGIERYRNLGGQRAIVATIDVDLDAEDGPFDAENGFLHLNCDHAEAMRRLRWLADLGYDDVLLRTTDHSLTNLQRIRELSP